MCVYEHIYILMCTLYRERCIDIVTYTIKHFQKFEMRLIATFIFITVKKKFFMCSIKHF